VRVRHLLFSCLALPIFLAIACGDDDTNVTPTTTDDAGPDTAPVTPTNDKETKQTGRIVKAREPDFYVEGATITIAGKTAVTNGAGEYQIIAPRNVPYQMTVTAPEYYKLIEQEWVVKNETFVRGDTTLLPNALANLLAGLLPERKPEKGILIVRVNPVAPCTSEEGSKVSIEPKGESRQRYFAPPGLPTDARDTVKEGEALSVAFYNVETGVPIRVTVDSPLCEQLPFPYTLGDVTYTGVQKTEGGDVISYIRTYIGPLKAPSDAGADAKDGS
jgi:hypothetical protein